MRFINVDSMEELDIADCKHITAIPNTLLAALLKLARYRDAKLWYTDGNAICGLLCMSSQGIDYIIEDCSLWEAQAHELW